MIKGSQMGSVNVGCYIRTLKGQISSKGPTRWADRRRYMCESSPNKPSHRCDSAPSEGSSQTKSVRQQVEECMAP